MCQKQANCNKTSQPKLNNGQLQEKIRKVAQELYEKRGRILGHEFDDWIEAEKIVKRSCK